MAQKLFHKLWFSPTVMTWMSFLLRMGGLAVLLPLILTQLNAREVLIWQLLATITMLVNWTDFGFSPTFARVIAYSLGGGSLGDLQNSMPDKGRRLLKSSQEPIELTALIATQRTIYMGMIACASTIALVAGTATLLHPIGQLTNPSAGWIAWGFTLVASQFTLLNGSQVSILTGFNKIATARKTEAAFGTLQLLSTSLVIIAGGKLIEIVACYSFWQLPLFLVNRFNVSRLSIPKDEGSISKFDMDIFRVIWPAAWRSGVGILMSAGIIQSSGLIYAQIATAPQAASYLLALRAFTALSQIAQAPFYTKLPILARLRAEGHHDELVKVVKKGMTMTLWLFSLGALTVTIFVPHILEIIKSSIQLPDALMCVLMSVAFYVERYGAMHMQVYSLTNHIIWHKINGITGGLSLVYFLAMFKVIGIYAMPMAMLFGYLTYYTHRTSMLSIRTLDVKRWPYELSTSVGPTGVLLVGLVAYLAFLK